MGGRGGAGLPQVYRNPSPRQMQTQMYGGDAAAIDTAVAQRERQDGFTRLLSVRVLPDLPFLRPASPDS